MRRATDRPFLMHWRKYLCQSTHTHVLIVCPNITGTEMHNEAIELISVFINCARGYDESDRARTNSNAHAVVNTRASCASNASREPFGCGHDGRHHRRGL